MSRKPLTRLERHAVAVLTIKRGDGTPIVSADEARGMTAAEIVRTFDGRINYEHSTPYAITKSNHPSGVTIMTPEEHAPKTKRDVTQIAKTKRIEKDQAAFRARLLAKTTPDAPPPAAPKRKSKIPSRPFPKAKGKPKWPSRPMRGRSQKEFS